MVIWKVVYIQFKWKILPKLGTILLLKMYEISRRIWGNCGNEKCYTYLSSFTLYVDDIIAINVYYNSKYYKKNVKIMTFLTVRK